jgi:V8-like Glu-specific endopeptidase
VEPLTQPPAFTTHLPGAPPTLRAPSANNQLFNPNLRDLGESVEPGAFGTSDLRFTSSRLVTDAVAALGGEKTYPYSIEGQLSFTEPSGNFVCSATVQRIGVITTAGHCVSDGKGHFFTNWVFVPATRMGSAPFGKWVWSAVTTTSTWFNGGGGVPNAQDVAVIVLAKNAAGQRIGSLTGYAGFNTPDLYGGQHVTVIGYPCNLDSCAKDHRTDAQASAASTNTAIVGTDAAGGSSGGGWLINFGQYATGQPVSGASDTNLNSLVAVYSYLPVPFTPLYGGASILDNCAAASCYTQCTPLNTCSSSPKAILNYACVHNPGAC